MMASEEEKIVMQNYFLTLAEAAALAPGNPCPSTVWRWARKGVSTRNGKRGFLKHVRVGGKIFTTEGWLYEFFRNLAEEDHKYFESETAAPMSANEYQRTAKTRQRDLLAADEQLAKELGVDDIEETGQTNDPDSDADVDDDER